ncbi:PREDICTED: uncharacterized protein LOC109227808 [Nicotiana attenuata]|uniref:uncharacterized protein LOC109227808 n=1 Tax=Nicotiana attenuata TaxID=49451 RepID=UPI000904C2DF|nr:PREDICTED: uncharacterized protein LOC109227808 [Nicotiana attenuata]
MKGMNIQFIAPIIQNGEKIVKLDLEDVEQENDKWRSAIVLYVIGDSPTIGATERFLRSVGKFLGKPQIYYHNDDYSVIRFSNLEERDQVLYSGPHTVNNRPIIMKAWSADFTLHDEVLKTIPLWVRFPNLPLNCWSMKALSKLGSALGNPVYADECTTESIIEMDVTLPLPRNVKLQDPKGKIIQQEITYDWELSFCAKCLKIGHDCNEQGAKTKDNEKQGKDDGWITVLGKSAARAAKAKQNEEQSLVGNNGFQSLRNDQANSDPGTSCMQMGSGGVQELYQGTQFIPI